MNDIEQKAMALVKDVRAEKGVDVQFTSFNRRIYATDEAICRAIEAHEATKQELSDYKQKVSDAVTVYWASCGIDMPAYLWFRKNLEQFIIPAPKPDPLVEVLEGLEDVIHETVMANAKAIRTALDACGLEIREKNDGV